jgi:hypothetical protein
MPPSIPISSLLNSSIPKSGEVALVTVQQPTANSPSTIQVHQNVYTNPKTTLSVFYMYKDANVWVEYPETNLDRPVRYLFHCDTCNWENPVRNFTYSLSKPSGQTQKGEEVHYPLLVDKDGNKVSCVVTYLTCMKTKEFLTTTY